MEIENKSYSKADMLQMLKERVSCCHIEDIFSFTVVHWQRCSDQICAEIIEKVSSPRIVVRSSSAYEDKTDVSRAGYFHSELNVLPNENNIREAVNKVVHSYDKGGYSSDENQILIQPQTENIKISGVVFTRQIETNAPYYVINYDDSSGRTDTVTGGSEGRVLYLSHFVAISPNHLFCNLVKAIKEIENIYPGRVLDIEFAITTEGKLVIFQVRPLAANADVPMPNDDFVKHLIADMAKKFKRFSKREPHLGGGESIFGDMPDWNPSEIIGSRPNTLDYSMYSFIVTDEVWHEARSSLGYYDVYPAELMVSFGKKPYIDTRASFNSLTPADISFDLREKLVHYYLDKLKANPAFQDKVEFEILWTCYDFSTADKINGLSHNGFSENEIDELVTVLRRLTNNILKKFEDITDYDLKQVKYLTDRRNRIMDFYNQQEKTPWNSLYTAYNILQNCKKFGTFPFSRQARLAFIAKSFLISMKDQQIVTEEFFQDFLNSIRTIASKFNDDFYMLQKKELSKKDFIGNYGHLRAGTYDITAPRYDSSPHLFSNEGSMKVNQRPEKGFKIPKKIIDSITHLMEQHGLHGSGTDLIEKIRSAIENREYTKFEFTRSLSDALELLAEAGQMLGFKREELCHVDLPTLMKFKNPEHGDTDYPKRIIGQSIERHRQERAWYDNIILPPLIASEKDLYFVKPYEAMPNFITRKSVKGRVATFAEIKHIGLESMETLIILLESADPGFDWIFTKNPLGIITKYGGVASHMAIRCAEFGIPAAIGCGDVIYDDLKKTKAVQLDCQRKIIKPLGSY